MSGVGKVLRRLVRRRRRPPRHEHVWIRNGYGGAGWSVYRCACGAVEVAP